ncbi:hypothetical protein BDY17DRAFT_324035 [Neohortaea acidophila]|uniref:Uncharacterized protein n=1 Tax=Neohortaea acidophila TaxID=245834 RepID=A0A6A6PTR4_9PEZI|nr:uncharacterized protein BDY17DRAFT_324035 [Neohortaea acidophila]KAF2483285.1 hypothetical protein BDY17DRAFT_324035 [Neohortaea acidophila]
MFNANFSFTPRPTRVDSFMNTSNPARSSTRSASPCTSGAPSPTDFSVTDLAAQFSQQRIQRNAQICYDSCTSYANTDDDASWSIPPLEAGNNDALHRVRSYPPPRPHSPSQRAHRQLHTQLLCTTSHRRDIAALIAGMVDAGEQCCVSPLSPEPSSPSADGDDEGYNSSDDASRQSSVTTPQYQWYHRRASDLVSSGACVSKGIRMRKERRYRRVRTAEQ